MQPEPYTNQLWPFTVITTRKGWVIAVVNTLHILGSEYLKGSHTGISSSLGISVPLPKKSGPFGSVRSLKMLEDGEKNPATSHVTCCLTGGMQNIPVWFSMHGHQTLNLKLLSPEIAIPPGIRIWLMCPCHVWWSQGSQVHATHLMEL